MTNKKVGVIIPCYNHVDFVEQAIDSVLNQTYQDFDVYAADDASTDGTREKLIQYDERLREIHLFDENQGGLTRFLSSKVDNEYTALLNSDDFWHEDKLKKQMSYMESNPDCAACFTWSRQVNEKGNEVVGIEAFQQPNRSSEEWMRYFYENGNCLVHPSILIRTNIYKELIENGNKAFRQIPDFQMWVNLILTGKIHVIEEKLMTFRWHSSGNSINVSAVSPENIARHYSEECYMWYETIAGMEEKFFRAAFGDMFVNKDAMTPEEIMCEKFFLLVRAKEELTRQAAIFYFYDIFKDKRVQDCFLEKYRFGKKDFFQLELEIGSAKIYLEGLKKNQIMREMGQCIIDANL
ncbi:glycosyltransferase family A protein [Clostridium sp. Marseille-P299]|uniref:glycosyltransferase family A protein n=1 Tax=Clostridium sp. Marseille-P299 TaxID=1805477 RepID=UPI00082F2BE0|nr:glycosyltransferase family A protein [Clostridium sp. Marseille-P299]